jgi:hypothetical protein
MISDKSKKLLEALAKEKRGRDLVEYYKELLEELREKRDSEIEKDDLLRSAAVIAFVKGLIRPLEVDTSKVRKSLTREYE